MTTANSQTAAPGVIYETERVPAEYVRAYNALMAQPTNRLRVRAVADILGRIDEPVKRVLDIACGGGAYVNAARAALSGGPRFFAMDRQFACVGGYRLNHPEAAGALADVTKLPVRNGAFDVGMCLDIIEHLDDDVGFLRGVSRLIRPGGWIVVSTHNSRSLTQLFGRATSALQGRQWLGWDPTHVRFYNEHSLRAKLTAAGFEPVAVNGTYYLPFHLPARVASWPLERLGLKSAARAVYNLVHAPFYALNYPFEKWSGTPMLRAFGWGIVVLARRR